MTLLVISTDSLSPALGLCSVYQKRIMDYAYVLRDYGNMAVGNHIS